MKTEVTKTGQTDDTSSGLSFDISSKVSLTNIGSKKIDSNIVMRYINS